MTVHRFFEARERRYRLLRLSPELLLDSLLAPRMRGGVVEWLSFDGLPEGVEIEAATYDERSAVFLFRLWHPSFDEVEPGADIPSAEVELTAHQIRVPKELLDNHFSNVAEDA